MEKLCAFCELYLAMHLEPMKHGPNWGLPLEHGSDDYCSHECWEKDIMVEAKLRGEEAHR